MRIGFIGTGRIARRLVRGLDHASHSVTVTPRSRAIADELAEAFGVTVARDAQAVLDASDVAFLCLTAGVARELLPQLAFRPDQAVVSVMGEFGIDELRTLTAPAREAAITIPMPTIERGGCPLPVHPASEALDSVLGRHNPIIPVATEADLDPFWAVAGSVASMLESLRTLSTWLGERIDDAEAGERYVSSLYAGYLGALEKDGAGRFAEALEELSLPGGLNATLRDRLSNEGHFAQLRHGLDALHARLRDEGDAKGR